MNTINKLGPLALGSRLKRLGEYIMAEGRLIYSFHKIDFDPKWFPVVYTLKEEPSLGIMEIAARTGFAHPSVISIVKELEKNGMVMSEKHKTDDRKRMLSLTPKALKLIEKMETVWQDIHDTIDDLLKSQKNNLLFGIEEMENAFNAGGLAERVNKSSKEQKQDKIKIIDYKPSLKKYFALLNYEWIEKYFKIEDIDRKYLENPYKNIIKKGGAVLYAEYEGEIVGTCGLINFGNGLYELTKMAVTPKAQGKQIGKKLCLGAIRKAKEMGAKKVFLLSNSTLEPALNLYKSSGFISVNFDRSKSLYVRSDVKMEIDV